jgi:hypothetical protein
MSAICALLITCLREQGSQAKDRQDTDDGDGLRSTLRDAPPGRYYIAIYTETPNPAETRRYTLSVSIP